MSDLKNPVLVPKEVLERFHSVQKSTDRHWKRLQRDIPDLKAVPPPVLFSLSDHERKLYEEKQSMMCTVVSSLQGKGRILAAQLSEVKRSQKDDRLRFERLQDQYLSIINRISEERELSQINVSIDNHLRECLENLKHEKEALLDGLEESRQELECRASEFQRSEQELIAAWKLAVQESEDLQRRLAEERA